MLFYADSSPYIHGDIFGEKNACPVFKLKLVEVLQAVLSKFRREQQGVFLVSPLAANL